MIAPGFESHQCLAGMWKRRLSCHAGRQEVSRCHTRGESQGMCNVTCMPPLSSNKAEPTLALKPRGDVPRSPKRMGPKIKKKIPINNSVTLPFNGRNTQKPCHIVWWWEESNCWGGWGFRELYTSTCLCHWIPQFILQHFLLKSRNT